MPNHMARPIGGGRPPPVDARAPRLGRVHLRPTDRVFSCPAEGRTSRATGQHGHVPGAEKAGIRLADYRDVPFRVGELMFDDGSFAPVKGKTNELFSALFHRRFARPELAYSETTAYPANRLSAKNMAAKLAVSTISDVRNTMYMSGLTAFPREHWQTLGPAMKRHAELHRKIAGHAARGPLKHFWGEASRYVGDDNPYSLFLATGIPFEVTAEPAADGFTFLSDADARNAGSFRSPGTVFVARAPASPPAGQRVVPESLPASVGVEA